MAALRDFWRALGFRAAESGKLKGSRPADTSSASTAGVAIGESADHAVITTVHVHGDAGKLVQGTITHRMSRDHLPADLPDFQGREDQTKRLKEILTGGGTAAVTAIGGMGGVGKSALALHVAHQLADAAPDGRIFVDLGGTSPRPLSPLAALTAVIQALEPEAQALTELGPAQRLYRSCLDSKRVLLLLDNAANSAQVVPLVEWRAPTTLVIVTSRQTIAAPGLTNLSLDVMEPGEARDLLRVALSERSATDKELNALSERCAKLPLALRAAGTFLALNPNWTVADYIEALADQRQRLALLRISDEPRLNVHAALGVSAQKLAEEAHELFKCWQMLAIFPTSFDRAAAAAVWGVKDEYVRQGLSELLRRSLLMYAEADDRYRLHDLMLDVARLPLRGEDQALVERRFAEAAARHARHYCRVLASAVELYRNGGEDILKGLRLYDLEQRNIADGQAWAVRRLQASDDAARLAAVYANAGYPILSLRLHPRAHIEDWLLPQLAASRKRGDRQGEGWAFGNLGMAYADLGEMQRAINHYEERFAIAREIGDGRGEAAALGNLGRAYAAMGQPRRAIEHYERVLTIMREIGDRRGEGPALGNLGNAYLRLGEPRRATEHYEQVLTIMRAIGDRRGEGATLGNLGLAEADLGDPRQAIEHFEQHLAIAREIGDQRGEGQALNNLGIAYADLDEPRRAIDHHSQALMIMREIGDRMSEGSVVGNLGGAHMKLGEARRAFEHFEQHLAIAREIGDRKGEGDALHNSAMALEKSVERAEAIRRMEEALRIYEEIDSPWQENARAQLAEWRSEDGG